MRTARRTRLLGAGAGFLLGATGLGLLLARAAHPLGTILTVAGLGFAGSMVAGLWIDEPTVGGVYGPVSGGAGRARAVLRRIALGPASTALVGTARAWAVAGRRVSAVAAGIASVGLVGVVAAVALIASPRVDDSAAADALGVGVFSIVLAAAVRLYGALLQLHARTLPTTRSRAIRLLGSVCFVVGITVADVILLWGMVFVALVFLL